MPDSRIHNHVFHAASVGKNIRVREWYPVGPEIGRVLVLHGLGDHSARHDWAAGLITDAGYRAVGFDWPGNGESDGTRGDMPTAGEAGLLLEEVITALNLDVSGVYAHSTGAFLLFQCLGNLSLVIPRLEWIWVSSPLLSPTHRQSGLKIAIARFLAPYFPLLTLSTGVSPGACYHTGSDPAAEAALRKDGVHHRVSLRFALNLMETEANLPTAVREIGSDIALLITQGCEDTVCPPFFAEELFNRLPNRGKCLLFASGARHEPFREPDHNGLTNAVRSWLGKRRKDASPDRSD